MTEIRRCQHCHSELPPDAPDGVCPQCVLRLGFAGRSAGDRADATTRDPMEPMSGSQPLWATPPYTTPGRFIPPSPQELAPHFPHLEIEELLGSGGMGAVYKARQRRLDRPVALKILPPEVAAAPGFADRFTREARALARLNHSHVVTVHDFGEAGGMFYFLMEYVDGANLRELIADGKLNPPEALAIVPQVCEALQYAHDEGIVHRDIKPENILLDKKGRVKIADFGLAKLLRGGESPAGRAAYSLTGSQQVMGTPHYMAPEQMERPLGVDHRADIYSLGVVFYEMLTGELPLGRFAPPSRKVSIDVRLDEVVLRTLEKEPQHRYQHASEVKSDVENISRAAPASRWPEFEPEAELDKSHFKDARSQVSLPALGLGLAGGAGFVISFIALFIVLSFTQTAHESPSAPVLASAISLAISLLIAAGGSTMARLRSFVLCRVACILAILPCHFAWLIGMPAGLCAWTVLSRPDVRAAFQRKPARTPFRSLALVLLTIAAGFLLGAASLVAVYLRLSSARPPTPVPPAPSSYYPMATIPPGWALTPTGPTLTPDFARLVLRLKPGQIEQANKILRKFYVEALALEALHMKQQHDDLGHLVVTIEPYPGPIAMLEDRLWSQLDQLLDRQQQSTARLNLELGPPERRDGIRGAGAREPGFFGWGKEGAHLELWRVGTWYHWKVQTRGEQADSHSDPQLPLAYRRFWKEPAEKKVSGTNSTP